MVWEILKGVFIPFLGTAIGASFVFFMRGGLNKTLQRILTGFAAGVMVAASVWSLLIPAMEESSAMGALAFVPAVVGFLVGIAFLLLIDKIVPHLHSGGQQEGLKSGLKKTTMLVLAVAIHNLPEGMAVGALYAGILSGNAAVSLSGALALSIGIAVQNLPEGAIISLPLAAENVKKGKAFGLGVLSGIVEPIGAIITILLSQIFVPILPYLLSFAAGAMMYVVVEELIPESNEGEHSNIGTIAFAIGFAIMMALDVALG